MNKYKKYGQFYKNHPKGWFFYRINLKKCYSTYNFLTPSFKGEKNVAGSLKHVLKELLEPVRIYKRKIRSNISQTEDLAETVIGRGTNIRGNIFSESILLIEGEVRGNIDCNNAVIVRGKVVGDIKCESAEIDKGYIEGNLNVADKLTIKQGSRIVGQVTGGCIEVSGRVKGDIKARRSIILHNNAYVFGDAVASIVSIGTGAYLEGTVII